MEEGTGVPSVSSSSLADLKTMAWRPAAITVTGETTTAKCGDWGSKGLDSRLKLVHRGEPEDTGIGRRTVHEEALMVTTGNKTGFSKATVRAFRLCAISEYLQSGILREGG
jgi:hypothetical protein